MGSIFQDTVRVNAKENGQLSILPDTRKQRTWMWKKKHQGAWIMLKDSWIIKGKPE